MAFWYYVFGTLLVVLGVTFGRDLYVVSHGNADNRRPGIYGGEMEENGTSPDLFSSGYHCAWFAEGSVSFNPLTIRAVSYDRKSNEALLTIIENMENKVSLMKAPICLDIPSCGNISQHLQPVFMHTRIAGGKMGPFALYDGVIYFVFVSEERMDDNTEITFEIRKVTCDNFPYSSIEAFVLSECTETVAVLHQVTINEVSCACHNTIESFYNTVQYNHSITYNTAPTNVECKSDFELITDPTHHAIADELWVVWYFRDNWPCFDGTTPDLTFLFPDHHASSGLDMTDK